jgi:hypothetical protein
MWTTATPDTPRTFPVIVLRVRGRGGRPGGPLKRPSDLLNSDDFRAAALYAMFIWDEPDATLLRYS